MALASHFFKVVTVRLRLTLFLFVGLALPAFGGMIGEFFREALFSFAGGLHRLLAIGLLLLLLAVSLKRTLLGLGTLDLAFQIFMGQLVFSQLCIGLEMSRERYVDIPLEAHA